MTSFPMMLVALNTCPITKTSPVRPDTHVRMDPTLLWILTGWDDQKSVNHWDRLKELNAHQSVLPLLMYCNKMTIYPTFYTAVHPLPQDICYWWSCIGHSTSNCLYNFKLTISFPSGIKKKKNPQPPAKNASFTYSTTHTMSENIAKSDISHQTYRVLYLKLLFLNSMSPSPLIAGLRHKLTEMYCVFWSWY